MQIDKRIAAPLPVWKRACLNGRKSGAASNSGRSQCQRARRQRHRSHAQAKPWPRARANSRAPKAHGWILDVLRVVMRAICPSCLVGGGRVPCAGYSGFVIEPCSGRLLIREEPRYAMHAPTNCQPFGRSDRPVAALSAVAICDAIRIGFLRQSLKLSSAGAVFD